MVMLISISASMLVIVAGMLLLARTKKDGLGNMFSFASYSVITIGLLVFLSSFVIGIMHCGGGKHGKGHGNYGTKCGQARGQESCASWSEGCSKSRCNKSSYHGNRSGAGCCKKGDRKWKKKKEVRKIITTGEDEGDEKVNIEIEIKE